MVARTAWRPIIPWKAALDIAVSLVMITAGGMVIWSHLDGGSRAEPSLSIPESPIDISSAATKGARDAPVALIAFSDFECPYCARFSRDTLPTILQNYVDRGRVLFAFRHFPLPIHANAIEAAAAAECAGAQDRFWEMHDALFAADTKLIPGRARELAERVGVDMVRFDDCVKNVAAAKINSSVEQGRQLGITATPSFFVGRRLRDGSVDVSRVISGSASPVEFETILEESLNRRTAWFGWLFSLTGLN